MPCENRQPLTIPFLTRLKKELIEAESGGLLEFVQSRFDLSMVAGSRARQEETARCRRRPARRTLRRPAHGLCDLRAGRHGQDFPHHLLCGRGGHPRRHSEELPQHVAGRHRGNLERVLTLLKAMSPIAVVVDEADAQLGNRSSSGDSGVSNRVFAQIAQFMGNTELRGKVIWFLLTCRPDLLPVDLKRQGRAEEHIALFYPQTDEERLAMFRAMQKKTGTQRGLGRGGEVLPRAMRGRSPAPTRKRCWSAPA